VRILEACFLTPRDGQLLIITFCAGKHSVGGLDYSTVRTGAFMGLRMLSSLAAQLQRQDSGRRGISSRPPDMQPPLPTNGLKDPPIGAHTRGKMAL
jgi:hypothetical protein